MTARDPVDLGAALGLLRWFHRETQAELAERAGVAASSLCEYETGKVAPSGRSLDRLMAALRFPLPLLDPLLACLHVVRQVIGAGGTLRAGGPPGAEADALAAGAGRAAEGFTRAALLLARAEPAPPAPSAADRLAAPGLRQLLEPFSQEERLGLVRAGERFRSWALAVLLCGESEAAAAHDPRPAIALARLAVEIARFAPGGERWRSELQGHCEAFHGNALRASGELPAAKEAFARSRAAWPLGADDEHGLLDASRRLDLEASLCRGERRVPEALALLDQALAICPPNAVARILVKKAKTLEEVGDYETAIATLERAIPLADPADERVWFALRFNLAENLDAVGRHAEAEPLVAEVRGLAERSGKGLHRTRLRWLEGRIAAASGRPDEAAAALREVRDELVERRIAYDAALATLELAALLAGEGKTAEVKALAAESAPIFAAQRVERERLAALTLFRQAAGEERLTAALARRLLAAFKQATHSP